ncbi:putative 3-hydroxyisobutyryl-CoA hydrolase [Helianthus annuus]|uniref:3-hydroxyisobutyryl-CoA hydrolase n=1 Tax=Helianthus annuus TaxID=4232 RepID=A0A251V6G3_HELAN|nr:probable 3-hydroxyisobutyryl-CoA hydrolase 3 [Helianthus annuus]KAF5813273.1 putative 3-hydroxyisobutyryl-CoA hydrolase [Helianthus annuus]KAJ0599461.1 putative 3-hydroxyisobutyryl-CoA hydrolase [Helianthus annuus]KAJ0607033.1 putative 3-hydroxyisobutyryl-CoA hydrolase [Helianthus annuus]KAJ0772946.1 putative 3-hydroxyisobutyryl-CoA hydrolase [Helianthus annuus]KAJ0934434.1 putative 3-hydroxyisobutyryl-CoA hydrolase [Helianthus annuus]
MALSVSNKEESMVTTEGISGGMKVILNRPRKLNALNYQLIVQMLRMLESHEYDPTIKFIILKGNGKAFCAGGDVTSVMTLTNAGNWSFGANFFRKQYSLDYLLGTYKKPLIAIINGIVMGGGAGLSMHAAFRIVTENTIFAMPEASIGSVPDVGSSHFLSRLPGFFGEYVALTGVRLNGIELVQCGLATHFVHSKDLASLENALSMMASSDAKNTTKISEIINNYANERDIKTENANSRLEIINKCFSKETVEDILLALETFAVDRNEKWIFDAIKSIKSASPLCIKLALKLIREGRSQKLEHCLAREHLVVSHLLRRTVDADFYEGPRAMLIDKDRKPRWSPSKLELVDEEMVRKCFSAIDDDDWQPLRLFERPNPSNIAVSRM